MKRFLDIIISFICLVVALPVMIVVAVAIKLDSRGPVLFKQERVGMQCKSFKIYKFRSMRVNSDKEGPYFTAAGDSRITRVGKLLRKTSLDELPQLMNVLVGHMSLVGPRPDVPAQEELYHPQEWLRRHQVRPGITGLAQATIRSEATMEQRKQLDLEYVDNASVAFDLKILLWTIRQVIKKGSY